MSRLPDFVVAGFPRSGSTTLYRMIDEHPSVFMAKPKEIGYFSGWHNEDVEWYKAHFDGASDHQRAGEATPWYMHDRSAVIEMKRVVPDVQIIAILRDPVDRTYSHYWMEAIRGRANGTFEEYLDSSDVLEVSMYAQHLSYMAEFFPRERILVVFSDDLSTNPAGVYSDVCEFLGVDSSYAPLVMGRTVNRYVEFRSLRLRNWAKAMPSRLSYVRRILDRANTRTSVSYPPMSESTRERLASLYAGPNADLALWLGREIPPWTQSAAHS
ncbi:MAG: sulfotransferase domain-containing protein [Actinomycetota bacterium]